jgi:hypothetical protein
VRVAGDNERLPGPGALPDPDSVVIPDDASALEPDYWALRAELAARRRDVRGGPGSSTAGRLASRVGPMLVGALILVAFLASLGLMVRPTTQPPTAPATLASSHGTVGSVGGLLPDATVVVNGEEMPVREARPAVVVWLPDGGADQALLDSLYLQASAYGIPLVLAGPPDREPELLAAAQETGPGRVVVMLDPESALLDGFGLPPAAGPVVAVVGIDGRLHAVLDDPPSGVRLESVLGRVAGGGAPTT